jgi:hypothetical protein
LTAEEPAEPTHQGLDVLWQRVVDAWDDDKAHKALLELAVRTQALPEIAARYRGLADDPERGARAREKLDAIVIAATQLLLSTKTPRPGKTPLSITLSAFGVAALLLAWLAYALWPHR